MKTKRSLDKNIITKSLKSGGNLWQGTILDITETKKRYHVKMKDIEEMSKF